MATGRLVDELYVMGDSKDLIKAADYTKWRDSVQQVGDVLLNSHQLEEARRCYMRLLDWPRKLSAFASVNALHGMARYHKVRKEWVKVIEYSKEALRFIPDAK